MIDRLTNSYGGYDVETVLINCHYPVTHDSFVLQYGIIVKKPTGIDDETADKLAAKFTEGIAEGFLQDVEIWKNKTRIDNPLLCEEDGPVYQLRRWYEQFYVDVADVTEKMTQRFEFEVDTTKANEAWQHEVEENLARQKAEREAAEGGGRGGVREYDCGAVREQGSAGLIMSASTEWAKAPDFAGQPARLEAIHAQTLADKANYLDDGMNEVECRTCGTCVLVRKNSLKHTSVQWTDDPAKTCPTFRDAVGEGQSTALREGCPRLWDSINHAVMEGFIDVRDRVE